MRAKFINENIGDVLVGKSQDEIYAEIKDKVQKIKDVDPTLVSEFGDFITVPGGFSKENQSNRTIINMKNLKMYNVGLFAYREVVEAIHALI